MKRLIALGDTHCGHFAGLTPPGWQFSKTGHRKETAKQQRETWNWFAKEVKPLAGADVAIWNGDLIDGRGERSGGTELITSDRLEQCAMAEAIVRTVGAQTNLFVYGTPYHTGQAEDYETQIAEEFDTSPHGHLWTNVNGWIVDAKHKVGSSGIPHGRHTAPATLTVHARGLFGAMLRMKEIVQQELNVGQRGGHYKAPAEAGAGSLKIELG